MIDHELSFLSVRYARILAYVISPTYMQVSLPVADGPNDQSRPGASGEDATS